MTEGVLVLLCGDVLDRCHYLNVHFHYNLVDGPHFFIAHYRKISYENYCCLLQTEENILFRERMGCRMPYAEIYLLSHSMARG
jgi:hypothetical protein